MRMTSRLLMMLFWLTLVVLVLSAYRAGKHDADRWYASHPEKRGFSWVLVPGYTANSNDDIILYPCGQVPDSPDSGKQAIQFK